MRAIEMDESRGMESLARRTALFLLVLFFLFPPSGQAQPANAPTVRDNYFLTGDYVAFGVPLKGTGQNGFGNRQHRRQYHPGRLDGCGRVPLLGHRGGFERSDGGRCRRTVQGARHQSVHHHPQSAGNLAVLEFRRRRGRRLGKNVHDAPGRCAPVLRDRCRRQVHPQRRRIRSSSQIPAVMEMASPSPWAPPSSLCFAIRRSRRCHRSSSPTVGSV